MVGKYLTVIGKDIRRGKISFSLKIGLIYNFYKINTISKHLLFLVNIFLIVLHKTDILLRFTDNVITFSLCENYLYNDFLKTEIENNMIIEDNEYENITFYDYETLTDLLIRRLI
jgi:hypothetical protein